MIKNNTFKAVYEAPSCEAVAAEMHSVLCASEFDSNDWGRGNDGWFESPAAPASNGIFDR